MVSPSHVPFLPLLGHPDNITLDRSTVALGHAPVHQAPRRKFYSHVGQAPGTQEDSGVRRVQVYLVYLPLQALRAGQRNVDPPIRKFTN
jgi:hypothetical protein